MPYATSTSLMPQRESYNVTYREGLMAAPSAGLSPWLIVALAAGGYYYLVYRPQHVTTSSSGTVVSTGSSPSTGTPAPVVQTSSGGAAGVTALPSAGNTSTAGSGGAVAPTQVVLTAPGTGTVGQPISLIAQAYGVSRPVYQFWVFHPDTGQWQSSGPYTLQNVFTFVPTSPGEYQVVAYARSVTAPTSESAAQRAVFETPSNLAFIVVV